MAQTTSVQTLALAFCGVYTQHCRERGGHSQERIYRI